jgi:hypothetical protein
MREQLHLHSQLVNTISTKGRAEKEKKEHTWKEGAALSPVDHLELDLMHNSGHLRLCYRPFCIRSPFQYLQQESASGAFETEGTTLSDSMGQLLGDTTP